MRAVPSTMTRLQQPRCAMFTVHIHNVVSHTFICRLRHTQAMLLDEMTTLPSTATTSVPVAPSSPVASKAVAAPPSPMLRSPLSGPINRTQIARTGAASTSLPTMESLKSSASDPPTIMMDMRPTRTQHTHAVLLRAPSMYVRSGQNIAKRRRQPHAAANHANATQSGCAGRRIACGLEGDASQTYRCVLSVYA
jgi:hypothetical protein